MLSGGFKIRDYDAGLKYLAGHITDAADATYDNVLKPVGNFFWEDVNWKWYAEDTGRIPLAIPGVNIALIALSALGAGCTTGDAETPEDASCANPRVYAGDGSYTLRVCDSVISDNGVKFSLDYQKREEDIWSSLYNDEFVVNVTIGDDPLVITYPFALMISEGGSSEVTCANIKNLVKIDHVRGNLTGVPTLTMTVSSLIDSYLTSRREAAEKCLENGGEYENCADAVPWEPFADEQQYESGIFSVMMFDSSHASIAEKKLRQLDGCYRSITDYLGFGAIYERIGYRVIPDVWPNSATGIQGRLDDSTAVVCHETVHLIKDRINMPQWMNEGLSQYFEEMITSDLTQFEPWEIYREFDVSAGENATDPNFFVESIDAEKRRITVSVEDMAEDSLEVPVPGAFEVNAAHSGQTAYAVAESIDGNTAHFHIYEPPYVETLIPTSAICMEESALVYAGLSIDGARRVPLASSDYPSMEVNYRDVTHGGNNENYSGGKCFWSKFVERFGEESFKNALQEAGKIRDENTGTNEERQPYCWAQIFRDAAGKGVDTFLNNFGIEAGDEMCLSPIAAFELRTPTGPSGEGYCSDR